MVVGKEDLGLTLSLACSTTNITTSTPPITPSTTHITPSHITPPNNNTNNNQHNMGFLMMMNRNNIHNPNNNNNNNNNLKKISSNPPLQLNLMMTPSINSSNSTPPPSFLQKLHRYPSDKSTDSGRLFLRGIDVNRPAGGGGGGGEEEEAGVSSPNSTVSTLSGGKRSRDSGNGGADEMEVERAESRGGVSDDGEDDGDGDGDGGENSRKKLRLTKDQSAILEESFKEHNTLNPKQKLALAKRLGLRPRQVEVWFQNRRARTKLKQTEVDCEFLKRCCEQLTEENRRLQKEVQELRTLKLSPQFYMQMTPPTTLTMCPSCERVAVPPSSSSVPHSKPLSVPDPRANPNHRVSPWVTSPVPIRSFDPLHPRS